MDIDVTSLTNAELSTLSQRVANERDARMTDQSRIPTGNRPAPHDPMAPYDARKRSLEDRVAELERRAGIVS